MKIDKKNIFLKKSSETTPYTTRGGGSKSYPSRGNRQKHGDKIKELLGKTLNITKKQEELTSLNPKDGIYILFSSKTGYDLNLKSLQNRNKKIRLVNVQKDTEDITEAIVFVPNESRQYFLDKVDEYLNEETKKGNPRNKDLIESIENIKSPVVESFWTDLSEKIPTEKEEWCEVWLHYEGFPEEEKNIESYEHSLKSFYESCKKINIQYSNSYLVFPERIVALAKLDRRKINKLIQGNDYLAELKQYIEPNEFFLSDLTYSDKLEFQDDLINRLNITINDENPVSINLLDTGIASGHPLLKEFIPNNNFLHTVNDAWGVNDHHGHGTNMAGISAFFDLNSALSTGEEININHLLESIKILPPPASRRNNPKHYGDITQQGIYNSEISNPNINNKIFTMAVTSDTGDKEGTPSTWSSAIDSVTAGVDEEDIKRLFLISAGNIHYLDYKNHSYPDYNLINPIEDPAQAWNAITVGAFNSKTNLEDNLSTSDWRPVANTNELSPHSRTSVLWESNKPIKPEIVLDGGNMVTNGSDFDVSDNLSLLTTNRNYNFDPFHTIFATSSATAQASYLAAELWNEYPDMWPETVRGLLVHSAEWTNQMHEQFNDDNLKTSGIRRLLRSCGYGVPSLDRAIQSRTNSVNLIVESNFKPFKKETGKNPTLNEMNFHKIPIPKELFQSLENEELRIKVTLSYFIEPSPGKIGWESKYRYPSYRLGFDLMESNETEEQFKQRINKALQTDDETPPQGSTKREWVIGPHNRNVGSIHSDFCYDTAINFSDSNLIAIYPQSGWWKDRHHLKKYNKSIRYSLIVTIEAPESEVDIYSSILNEISNQQTVSDEIDIDISF